MIDNDTLIAERDALVSDLQERWPALTEEMVALLRRLEANRRYTEAAGIDSAEAIARGLPSYAFAHGRGDFQDVARLALARIPQLDASTPYARTLMAWGR